MKDYEKRIFIERYIEGLNKLCGNEFDIVNYRKAHDSEVKKLFGGWISFGRETSNYEEAQRKEIFNNSGQDVGNLEAKSQEVQKKISIPEKIPKESQEGRTNRISIKEFLENRGQEYHSPK